MTDQDLWTYTLGPEDEGRKFQEILLRRFHFSRKLIHKLKQGEHFWVNGEFRYLNSTGKAGDQISVDLNLDEQATITGEDISLDILYEDDYLLAINKPPGLVIHPTPRYPTGTLGNAVVGYWQRQGISLPFRPVSRLDRNTSGIVIVAKNSFTHHELARQSAAGLLTKRYLGWVQGVIDEPQDQYQRIDAPIGLEEGSFIKRMVRPDGRPARTRFKILKQFSTATLLELILETGRTHQIRAHCQFLGHPLLGDDLYGGSLDCINRQALHALSFKLLHPYNYQPLTITAPLPEDLCKLNRKLKIENSHKIYSFHFRDGK